MKSNGVQYYTAGFEYSLTPNQEGTDVNLKYDEVINCIPVKRRMHNYHLREDFDVDKLWERGDKGMFAMTLRPNYNACRCPKELGGQYEDHEWYLREGSTQIINHKRIDYWINKERNKYALTVRDLREGLNCEGFSHHRCATKVVCHKLGDREPCDAWELARITMPGGEKKNTCQNTHIQNKLVGTAAFGYMENNANCFANLKLGDKVLIRRSLGNYSIPIGQYRTIVKTDVDGFRLDIPRAGLQEDERTNVSVSIYEKAISTVGYVTDDGIDYLNIEGEGCMEETIVEKKEGSATPITGIAGGPNQELMFLSNGVLSIASGGYNAGSVASFIDVGSEYDSLLTLNNYVVLLGPDNLGIGYYYGTSQDGQQQFKVKRDVAGFGYFNKGSYVYNNTDGYVRGSDQLVIANSRGTIRNYKIEPYDDKTGNVNFNLNRTNVGERYINTDVRKQKRERGDLIYISSDPEYFFVFLVNENTERIVTNEVLVYIQQYNHYVKWIHCDESIVLLSQYGYSFSGNGDYMRGHETQDVNKNGEKSWIYQAISGMFGDLTFFDEKEFYSIEVALEENTNFSRGYHRLWWSSYKKDGIEERESRTNLNQTMRLRDVNRAWNSKKYYEVMRDEGPMLLPGDGLYSRKHGIERGYKNRITSIKQKVRYAMECEGKWEDLRQQTECIAETAEEVQCSCINCRDDHFPEKEKRVDFDHHTRWGLLRSRYGIVREDVGDNKVAAVLAFGLEAKNGNYFTTKGIRIGYNQVDPETRHSNNVIPALIGPETEYNFK